MITDGQKFRARVLKVEDGVVALGIYVEGEWVRISARTNVPLVPGSWIVGHLSLPTDGSMVMFKLETTGAKQEEPPTSPTSGLDLEA